MFSKVKNNDGIVDSPGCCTTQYSCFFELSRISCSKLLVTFNLRTSPLQVNRDFYARNFTPSRSEQMSQ